MKSLLTAVRKYPIGENDPLENFITEAWAWTLSKYQNLSTEYIKWSFEVTEFDIEWKTQEHYNGYIDLMGISDSSVFIFEHKVDAGFQDNQLKRYLDEAKKRHKNLKTFISVIARNNRKSEVLLSGCVSKTWAEIVLWLEKYKNKLQVNDIEERFVIENIIDLLKSEGLGPMEPINENTLKNYYLVYGLEDQLKGIFRRLRDEVDWKKVMKEIPRSDKEGQIYIPRSIKDHYGRIGIEFSRDYDWNPGCFFGVLLDPTDHGLIPPENGPDLCFILSFNRSHHSTYSSMPEFESLKKEMKELEGEMKNNKKGWYFYDHLGDKHATRKNKWHPLYMRWSFANFISFHNPEQQTNALRKEIESFMASFFKGCPSFLVLRKKLMNK